MVKTEPWTIFGAWFVPWTTFGAWVSIGIKCIHCKNEFNTKKALENHIHMNPNCSALNYPQKLSKVPYIVPQVSSSKETTSLSPQHNSATNINECSLLYPKKGRVTMWHPHYILTIHHLRLPILICAIPQIQKKTIHTPQRMIGLGLTSLEIYHFTLDQSVVS